VELSLILLLLLECCIIIILNHYYYYYYDMAGHVVCVGKIRNAYKILVGNPEENRTP
jgi:hypothetical protein